MVASVAFSDLSFILENMSELYLHCICENAVSTHANSDQIQTINLSNSNYIIQGGGAPPLQIECPKSHTV